MLRPRKSKLDEAKAITQEVILHEVQALRKDVHELRGWVMSIMVMLGGAALSLIASCV